MSRFLLRPNAHVLLISNDNWPQDGCTVRLLSAIERAAQLHPSCFLLPLGGSLDCWRSLLYLRSSFQLQSTRSWQQKTQASLTVRLSQKSEGGGGAMVPVLWDELVPFGETKRKLQVRIYSKNDPKNPNVATEIGRTYPEDFGDPSRGNAAARGEYAVNFSFPRPGEYEVVVDYMLQNAAAPASQSATFTLISKYDIDEDASPYFWHLAAAGFTNF
eukprot:gnl/TRDRNA2_/TRDRNA2_32731_c0_seq2.p1 gnl/TRDRNA2_/TRDRNA2_32731_c0~~gnl/TRDRNA2_/TRDRNA2_32731_c0_seq2.p1  ORF type:complete len:216 (-),score=25.48 gnl/TRDRNA2_/TRDRNA2_32731_c0_seq2:38-685(-)